MPEWFRTQSTIKNIISQGMSTMSNKSALTIATIETVCINMVPMIVIDWNGGTNSGWHHCSQRTTGNIAIWHGYIYTPCILGYDKHSCITMEVGNSALDMHQAFIYCCFYSCCSWFPILLTMMVFTNTTEPIYVLTLHRNIILWRMCSSGGIVHHPRFCV